MSEPSRAVFLSYASQDAEAARRLCEALRAGGIEVWFDQGELRGGDAWDAAIRCQINNCGLFIPVLSRNTLARGEGYFRLEWKLAVDRSRQIASNLRFLMPVVIDDTDDTDDRVPDKFREVQWARLPAGQTPPAFVERVSRLLSPAQVVEPSTAGATAAGGSRIAPRVSRKRRAALLLVVTVAVAGIGYFTVAELVRSKHGADFGTSAAAQTEKSIAVLPFTDMSETKNQEYFADGVAEEILNLLAKIPGLKVIGRTSSFQFKGRNEDPRAVGQTLGARYLLEGSVRQADNTMRLTAQLIDARDGSHVWSETYDRPLEDLLKVQNDVAAALVRMLELSIGLDPLTHTTEIKNVVAYNDFLKGLAMLNRFDEVGVAQAETALLAALTRDPGFVRAREELAFAHFFQAAWGFTEARSGFDLAEHDANRLLEDDSNSAYAKAVLGGIAMFRFDWSEASRQLAAARAEAPNNIFALFSTGSVAGAFGRWAEATKFFNMILTFDPLNSNAWNELGFTLYRAGQFAEGEAAIRRCLSITPTFAGAHADLGFILFARGQSMEALAEFKQDSDAGYGVLGRALVFHALGRKTDADAALAELERSGSMRHAYRIAQAHAFRGERDEAFRWLDLAYTQQDSELQYVKGEWLLRSLEKDPRYAAFLRKMNLPE